jgi:hypothetical protein
MYDEYSLKNKHSITKYYVFKDNTLHTVHKLENKTCNHALKRFCSDNALSIYNLMKWKDGL